MAKHDHYGHRERVRQRVRKESLENFEEHQVLEYLLHFTVAQRDTNDTAHDLIKTFGSFSKVLEASEDDLKKVKGVGDVSAHFLSNLLNVFNYYEKKKTILQTELTSPHDSFMYFKNILGNKIIEEVYVVCLTPMSKIVSLDKIAQGSISDSPVALRDITSIVLSNKCSNIIIAHNHPKGIAEPSLEDDKFTKGIVTAMALNGVHVLDHIIIGENDYYSYRRTTKLETYRNAVVSLLMGKSVAQNKAKYGDDDDKK